MARAGGATAGTLPRAARRGRSKAAPRPVAPAGGRRLRRRAILLAVLSVLASGAFLWLRDSSLVAVKHVQIQGVRGASAAEIKRAIERAASGMTTMHTRPQAIESALARYPTVRSVTVSGSFPSTLRVAVVMHQAVALVMTGPSGIAVAEDGSLMDGVATAGLPKLRAGRAAISSDAVTGRTELDALRALAAIPAADRSQVAGAFSGPRGIVVKLDQGTLLYMGAPTRLAEKWAVAARVLRDPDAATAAYVDVRIPERPVVGGVGSTDAAAAGDATAGAAVATPPASSPAPGSAPAPAPQQGAPAPAPGGAPAPTNGAPEPPPAPNGGAGGGP